MVSVAVHASVNPVSLAALQDVMATPTHFPRSLSDTTPARSALSMQESSGDTVNIDFQDHKNAEFLLTGRKLVRTKAGRHIVIIYQKQAKRYQKHLKDEAAKKEENVRRKRAGLGSLPAHTLNELRPVEVDGAGLFALDASCFHKSGPLHNGDIEEIDGQDCLKCPWHHRCVNIASGEWIKTTGVCPDKSDLKIINGGAKHRTHRVTVAGSIATIHVGTPSEEGQKAEARKTLNDITISYDMQEGEITLDSDSVAFHETDATKHIIGSKAKGILSAEERMRKANRRNGTMPRRL